MEFAELISAAKARFGNHSEVARALGMTPRAYRDIRSPERPSPPPARLVSHLNLLLQVTPEKAARRKTKSPAPATPPWIVSTPGVGLTCTACGTVAEGIGLDSVAGSQFVADHAGHQNPYPAMRRETAGEVGA